MSYPLFIFEGPTFICAAPLHHNRPGINVDVRFTGATDIKTWEYVREEKEIWQSKVELAKQHNQVAVNRYQYGVRPRSLLNQDLYNHSPIRIPTTVLKYSRIGIAQQKNDPDLANVLACSEILKNETHYLFAQRGNKVAYHSGLEGSKIHALVAGNFPEGAFISPSDMSIAQWFAAQQVSEHQLEEKEVTQRVFLGAVLDKTLGLKPDLIFSAQLSVKQSEIEKREATDHWETDAIVSVEPTKLLDFIVDHSDPSRHVPPGYGGAILELLKNQGLSVLKSLNSRLSEHNRITVISSDR